MILSKPLKIIIAIASLILAIFIFRFMIENQSVADNRPIPAQLSIVTITGTIHKIAVEGTCYQLATSDGKKYELLGKFPKFDGLKAEVTGTIPTDIMTLCQVGQPIQVKSLRTIE